jgi:hypothetical protein
MTRRATANRIELAGVAIERLWRLGPVIGGSGRYIPQANDLQKIFDLVRHTRIEIVDQGKMAQLFNFDPRQASYYIEAGRELSILEWFSDDSYTLSSSALRIRSLPESAAMTRFVLCALSVPIILRALGELREQDGHWMSRDRLRTLVSETSGERYTGTTLERRVESVVAWLRWLENNSEFMSEQSTTD